MSLFARLYLIILIILTLTSVTVLAVLDRVNRQRFDAFVERHVSALEVVAAANWQTLEPADLDDWLAVLTRLTGTAWREAGEDTATARWWAEDAGIGLHLEGQRVTARVDDWDDLLVGTGYLMLNAVSLAAPENRDARLATLADAAGLKAQRTRIQDAQLDFLQRRQLQQGQASVLVRDNGERIAALPVGGGDALLLGPAPGFAWLTPLGLLAITLATLVGLGGVLYFALVPFRRRLERIVRSAGAIEADPTALTLPEQPLDELGRMCQHLNRMAARLIDHAQRNRELNQAVSHDLRTPLAQFKFGLALLDTAPEHSHRIAQLGETVERMEHLLDELLLFHRLDSHSRAQGDTATEVRRLLLELVEHTDCPNGITLSVNDDAPSHPVRGEPRLLERLFANLVGNALRHARSQVVLSVQNEADRLVLHVDDDGPGIPEDQAERVFEPFYRLDPARGETQAGSGLGLAICQRICASLGGRIRLTDSPLGGCRAELDLPLTLSDKAATQTADGPCYDASGNPTV